jgi:hypothetical protein
MRAKNSIVHQQQKKPISKRLYQRLLEDVEWQYIIVSITSSGENACHRRLVDEFHSDFGAFQRDI